MKKLKKGNIIVYIDDGIESLLGIKGYYVFADNWLTKFARTLYDKSGNEYNILEFHEIEDHVLDGGSWRRVKRSCVKLDKPANIGNILFES